MAGARHFTGLVAWQLADEVRRVLFELSNDGPAARDLEYRRQLRRAADSACDNIAEGFGRYSHREFARFLVIAKSSLDEAESQVLGGLDKGYFLPEDAAAARTTIARARRAILGLKRYLATSQAPTSPQVQD